MHSFRIVIASGGAVLSLAAAFCIPGPAAGADFDGDDREDLAIGVAGESLKHRSEGAVHVLYGAHQGFVDLSRDLFLSQETRGVPSTKPESGDRFGGSLAGGDFNGDGRSDLVVGSPRADLGRKRSRGRLVDAGAITVFYAAKSGISARRSALYTLKTPGMPGRAPRRGANFGGLSAAGDFDGDGRAELAVIGSTVAGKGRNRETLAGVFVLRGSRRGLTTRGARLFTPRTRGLKRSSLGAELAVGDFDGNRRDDLAIGAVIGSGAVHILYGSRRGLTVKGNRQFTPKTRGLAGGGGGAVNVNASRGEAFGYALAAGDFGRSRGDDLAIGSPFRSVSEEYGGGHVDAGAVRVIYGSRRGLTTKRSQIFTEATPGLTGGGPETADRLGQVLSASDFDGSGRDDLAVGAAQKVRLLYSDGTVLSANRSQLFTSRMPGLAGQEFTGLFGLSVDGADLNGDGFSELMIGAPDTDHEGICGGGGVHILAGSGTGTTLAGNVRLSQDTPGIEGDGADPCDLFGATLLEPSWSGSAFALG